MYQEKRFTIKAESHDMSWLFAMIDGMIDVADECDRKILEGFMANLTNQTMEYPCSFALPLKGCTLYIDLKKGRRQ